MTVKFKQDDLDQVVKIQRELTAVCIKYRGNTEALLVVFALLRVARVLFFRYPTRARTDLVEQVITPFFNGDVDDDQMIRLM